MSRPKSSALDGPAQTGFLAYGFPTRLWDKPVECAGLFNPGRQPLVASVRRHIGWWDKYILGDSAGWPSSAHEYIVVDRIGDEPISYQGVPWMLRVVTVQCDGPTVRFDQGRPTTRT